MKLNFWQIIGVVLLVVGLGVYAYTKLASKSKSDGQPPKPPTTQPTQPAGNH